LDPSSFRWFETWPCSPIPRGHPSSLVQQGCFSGHHGLLFMPSWRTAVRIEQCPRGLYDLRGQLRWSPCRDQLSELERQRFTLFVGHGLELLLGIPISAACVREEDVDGKAVWGLQTHSFQCPFYDSPWHLDAGPECFCNTPLVLSFDDRPVTFTAEAGAAFDLTRNGVCHASDWPTAATPWLALDRDGNGAIDDGGELFGSATKLASGAFASNGFEALRELDADHNSIFDARDPAFANVVVWTDKNLDRQSSPRELSSLEAAGVTSIDLHDHRDMRCDARGNCEGERSGFAFVDASGKPLHGTVIDVYLSTR
jgi:hypothetical protein